MEGHLNKKKLKDQPSFRGNQGRDPLKNNRQRREINVYPIMTQV